MLEDNLDANSYRAMRALAFSVFGDNVEYYRNPCPGCFRGNDTFSFGDRIESHTPEDISGLVEGDGFSLDGRSYRFPGETDPAALRVEDVLAVKRRAAARNLRYSALWRAERQGIFNRSITPISERVFEVPVIEEMLLEVQMLRSGLVEDVVEE